MVKHLEDITNTYMQIIEFVTEICKNIKNIKIKIGMGALGQTYISKIVRNFAGKLRSQRNNNM